MSLNRRKIAIIGAGHVGSHGGYALISQGLAIKEQPKRFGKLDLNEIALKAKKAGWIILGGKGSTEFGIGASIANVVKAIFGDENRILPVSTLLQGQYGYSNVFASVPCRLNNEGIAEIIELKLTAEEKAQFDASVKSMTANFERAMGDS